LRLETERMVFYIYFCLKRSAPQATLLRNDSKT
jgi:hypothetical protein